MSERGDWADLRERRMAEPGARDGYEAERRAYQLGQAVKTRRRQPHSEWQAGALLGVARGCAALWVRLSRCRPGR